MISQWNLDCQCNVSDLTNIQHYESAELRSKGASGSKWIGAMNYYKYVL